MAILETNPNYELRDFESKWNFLLSRSLDNNPFQTYEWITTCWKHFGKGQELKLFTSENNGEVSIIIPIMYSSYKVLGSTRRKASFACATADSSISDYNAFLITDFQEAAKAVNLVMEKIVEDSDVDQLVFREVSEDSVTASLFRGVKSSSFEVNRSADNICPYVPLPDKQETFLHNIGHNMRRNLKVWQRDASKDYKVEFITYNKFGSLKDSMKILFDLHQKSQVAKGNCGVFSDEICRNFHMDLATAFAKRGWLSLYFLTFNDEPVSTIYSFEYKGKLFAYLCGFDPDYAEYRPGHLAFKNIMDYGIAKGLKELDLLRGDEEYKMRWNPMIRKNIAFNLTKKGLKSKFYNSNLINKLSFLLK